MKKLVLYLLPFAAIYLFASMLPAGAGTTPSSLTSLRSPTPVFNGPVLGGRLLNIGETVTVAPSLAPGLQRPVGSFAYAPAGALAYVKTGSAATAWELFGPGSIASGAQSAGALAARGAALAGTTDCFREDFIATPAYALVGAGSGVQALDTAATGHGGWERVLSGATAGSSFHVVPTGADIGNPTTARWYLATRFKVIGAVDAQTTIDVGLTDGTPTKDITIGICGGVSTTAFVFNYDTTAGACTGTTFTTGITTIANTHLWELVGTNGAGQVQIYADGVLQTTVTMSSTTAVQRLWIEAKNGATAASREVSTDFMQLCWAEL